ncbi:putative serpin E3 [Folsomia candida]|uniref:Putative serpin E3 n=1 Tax=Folsomia candida TaxID=158441 RepID=A0A226ETZ3_FOLCA|nr:putative serpin E3 [Folsomia candida]
MFDILLIVFTLFCTGTNSSPKTVEQFSFTLHQHLYNENTSSNAIWSPISVYSSLVPFLNGASGVTLTELQTFLGVETPDGQTMDTLTVNDTSVQICTGIFVQDDIKLKEKFSSSFKNVQTFKNSSNLKDTINDWMKNATMGLISSVGTWRAKFRKDKTLIKPFYGLKNTTQVEMMQQKSVQNYGQFSTVNDEVFDVMKMGYRDSAMHIIFVIPENPKSLISVYKYLKTMEPNKLGEILERLEPTELEIQVPKMKVESTIGIQQALEKAGLKSIFSTMTADLSNMFEEDTNSTNSTASSSTKPAGIHVDKFVHKTILELDEDGTKVGAATAAIFLPLSGLAPKVFVVDKPFIVLLRWEGKWTFFEGVVTDVEGNLVKLQAQNNLEEGIKNETATPVTITRRNNSNNEKWWVQNGPPEYLSNSSEDSSQDENKSARSKFQQPEPLDPYGIRFPNHVDNEKRTFFGTFHGEKINPLFVSEE